MRLTRRAVLRTGAAALVVPAVALDGLVRSPAALSQASAPAWKHGLSLFGDLKYPAAFKQFVAAIDAPVAAMSLKMRERLSRKAPWGALPTA